MTSQGAVDARTVSRDVLIYASGDVVTRALGFISVPIYTHVFLPAEYSLLAFVTTLATLAAGIAILGGDTVLTRFWFEGEAEARRRTLVTTWIGFLALSSTVLCLVVSVAVPALSAALLEDPGRANLLWLVFATVPVANTSRMLAQILRNEFRPLPYALTSFAVGAIALLVGLLLVFRWDMGIAGILTGILAAESTVLVIRATLTRSMIWGRFDAALLRRLLRFGLPLVPVTVSFWVFTASDRVVLAKLGGFEELGYYSVALSLVSMFALLSAAVGQAWVPRIFRLFERDRARAADVVGASICYYVFALGFAALLLSAVAPELVGLLASPDYGPAAEVVPLLALGAVAYGSSMLTASGLTLTYRTGRLSALSVVAAAGNVVLALALVPALGMIGAALGSLLGYLVLTMAYFLASQRVWHISMDWRRLVATAGVLALSIAAVSLLRAEPMFLRLLVAPIYVVGTALLAGVNQSDLAILRALIGPMGRRRRPRRAG